MYASCVHLCVSNFAKKCVYLGHFSRLGHTASFCMKWLVLLKVSAHLNSFSYVTYRLGSRVISYALSMNRWNKIKNITKKPSFGRNIDTVSVLRLKNVFA